MLAPPPITSSQHCLVTKDTQYQLCRETNEDPHHECELQHDCDQFLKRLAELDDEDDWVNYELGRDNIHRLQASCLSPPDLFEHWTVGPPFHCSFTAVSNPIYDLWTNHHDAILEFKEDSHKLEEWVRQLVGRDGCYLKQITERSGCVCIWNDQDKFMFHFWGSREAINLAVKDFHYHAAKFIYKNISRDVTFDTYAELIHVHPVSSSRKQ